jgi:hypothetical protein
MLVKAHRVVLDVLVAGFPGVLEQVDEADLSAARAHEPQRIMSRLHDLIIVKVTFAPRRGHGVVSLNRDDGRPGAMRLQGRHLPSDPRESLRCV